MTHPIDRATVRSLLVARRDAAKSVQELDKLDRQIEVFDSGTKLESQSHHNSVGVARAFVNAQLRKKDLR